MMKRRRSKYRIVVKTKAQMEREKLLKQRKQLRERQEEMRSGGIFSGIEGVPIGIILPSTMTEDAINAVLAPEEKKITSEEIEKIRREGGFIMKEVAK